MQRAYSGTCRWESGRNAVAGKIGQAMIATTTALRAAPSPFPHVLALVDTHVHPPPPPTHRTLYLFLFHRIAHRDCSETSPVQEPKRRRLFPRNLVWRSASRRQASEQGGYKSLAVPFLIRRSCERTVGTDLARMLSFSSAMGSTRTRSVR